MIWFYQREDYIKDFNCKLHSGLTIFYHYGQRIRDIAWILSCQGKYYQIEHRFKNQDRDRKKWIKLNHDN